MFDADYAHHGLSKYRRSFPDGLVEGTDLGVMRLPGSERTVAFFDNRSGKAIPGTEPRSAVETDPFIRSAAHGNTRDEYWTACSFMLPAESAPLEPGSWVTLLGPGYGAPYNGPSPLGIGFNPYSRSHTRLVLGSDPSLLGKDFLIPTDTWLRITLRFKFGYEGWVEMWLDEGMVGAPQHRVHIRGRHRLEMATMGRGVNDGWHQDPFVEPNSSRVSAYGAPCRLYVGHHVVWDGKTPASHIRLG